MKKVLIAGIAIIVIVSGLFIYNSQKNKNDDKKKDPISEIMTMYRSYKFHDVVEYSGKSDVFTKEDYAVNYDLTSEDLKIEIGDDNLFTVRLIDDVLHIIYKDVDYKYEELGEVDRVMEYISCNCNDECIKVIALTETGKLYYVDLYDAIKNLKKKDLFKLIESENKYTNIGYINNLNVYSECGINGISATTDKETEVILDDNLEVFSKDYYKFIGDDKKSLYIYPDGSIELFVNGQMNDIPKLKVSEAFLSKDKYYVIDIKGYLYEINDEAKVKKISESKAVKLGYRTKDDKIESAIVIYEDATARTFEVDSEYEPLS